MFRIGTPTDATQIVAPTGQGHEIKEVEIIPRVIRQYLYQVFYQFLVVPNTANYLCEYFENIPYNFVESIIGRSGLSEFLT